MIEVESLNRQAQELMERTSSDQALAIREPLADINKRWDDLLKNIVERQVSIVYYCFFLLVKKYAYRCICLWHTYDHWHWQIKPEGIKFCFGKFCD